jgi:hypothetical protein
LTFIDDIRKPTDSVLKELWHNISKIGDNLPELGVAVITLLATRKLPSSSFTQFMIDNAVVD